MKRFIAWLCLLTLAITMTTASFAAEKPRNFECLENSSQISGRMEYFALVIADMSIDENGQAEYIGVYSLDVPQKVKLTVSLQRSKDGKTWSNVPGASVTKTYYDKGMWDAFGTSDPLPRAYNYRTKVVATALSSSGSALETVTVYSLTQAYSLEVA